ncbi:MAG TPA: 8-amino-7-oxononanoate synthase [Capsulimonadaceae bacterium]|jgi:8-amino-7-oxononanoate synthase
MPDINVVLAGGLRDRQGLGLSRHLPTTTRPRIDLGSNDYLGLATNPAVIDAANEAVRKYGAGSTGSRLISGNIEIHEALEADLAALKHAEAALLFPSGYQAAVGTIPALVGPGDLVLSDELNHASLIDGCRMSKANVKIYSHNNIAELQELLAGRRYARRCLILTDGVFSMDGDVADLASIASLKTEFDAWLMVDDAHGTGVIGETGAGSAEYCGALSKVDVHLGTLSKALGASGGFVAGSRVVIDHLINNARSFIYSTGPSPASSGAALASLKIIKDEPDRRLLLRDNADYLRRSLRSIGFPVANGVTPIIPVVIGGAESVMRLADHLRDRFGVVGIRPPTVPEGTSRLRLTVKATHSHAQIDEAIGELDSALRKFGWRQFVLDGFESEPEVAHASV